MIDNSLKLIENFINFCNQSVEDVRMFCEVVAEGRESVGGRLEAGSDEDNSLSMINIKLEIHN